MNPALKIDPALKRYPHRPRELLQAWDSADELLLQTLTETPELAAAGLAGDPRKILVLGDLFGAQSCALAGRNLSVYTDSYVSDQAIRLNSRGGVTPFNRLDELAGPYPLVLIRIPKNMSFFEDMLARLSGRLAPGAKVICGYMIKHQAKAAFELLDRYIGETRTSLARKKARLIFADFRRAPAASPYPLQVPVESFAVPFVNHSNLFSREKLDIGTRFFLEHLPQAEFPVILDLGCANGIVGIAAKRLNPKARIIFSDDSRMAIESARINYAAYFPDSAEFRWTDCYENPEPGSVNLVLCNPPFHQGSAIGDQVARRMFADARRALAPGGVLRVIGNTHLGYPALLENLFGNSRVVARHPKFTVAEAVLR